MEETLTENNYISRKTLRKYNIAALILHIIQGCLLLVASQTVTTIKDFNKEVTISYLDYDNTTRTLISKTKNAFPVEIGLLASIFILLSAFAHAFILFKWDKYIAYLEREINPYRWYEYALSSSLMICGIAILFGCYDLGSLILIFISNACMNFFGLLMEMMNPPQREKTNWLPFNFGCLAGAGSWIVVFLYFFGSANFDLIPGFVYGILFGYIFFFNTFAINMFLQYSKIGRWKEYRYGELVYIILSLLSKSLLGWLVFGGTFQPN